MQIPAAVLKISNELTNFGLQRNKILEINYSMATRLISLLTFFVAASVASSVNDTPLSSSSKSALDVLLLLLLQLFGDKNAEAAISTRGVRLDWTLGVHSS